MFQTSICIPTYNGGRFISQAIQSILGQSFKDFNLIIVDDASSDDTVKLAQRFTDPRITIKQNSKRLGLVGNWNTCLDLACGEYIHIFHQDDKLRSTALERLVGFLDKHPNTGFVFSNIITIDSQNNYLEGHWNPGVLPDHDSVISRTAIFNALLQHGNFIPCPTVMMRKGFIHAAGKFDPRLRYTPDLEMWLRLSLRANVGYINAPLVFQRRHEGQESQHYMGKPEEIEEVWRAIRIIFTEHKRYIPDPEDMYQDAISSLIKWSWYFAKLNFSHMHFRSAWSCFYLNNRFRRMIRTGLKSLPPPPDVVINPID